MQIVLFDQMFFTWEEMCTGYPFLHNFMLPTANGLGEKFSYHMINEYLGYEYIKGSDKIQSEHFETVVLEGIRRGDHNELSSARRILQVAEEKDE